jgi:hypothetical protein
MIALSRNSGTAFVSKVSDQKNAHAEGLQAHNLLRSAR